MASTSLFGKADQQHLEESELHYLAWSVNCTRCPWLVMQPHTKLNQKQCSQQANKQLTAWHCGLRWGYHCILYLGLGWCLAACSNLDIAVRQSWAVRGRAVCQAQVTGTHIGLSDNRATSSEVQECWHNCSVFSNTEG